MKILIVNTSAGTGGAAIAAWRLLQALQANGHKAKMLVADRDVEHISVVGAQSAVSRKACFVGERLWVLAHRCSRVGLWDVDPARFGVDITRLPEFREADVVHIHWVQQGFLSLSGLKRIVDSGKRVVVTLHDMWAMTGLCHYAHECERWVKDECRDCPLHGCRRWAHRAWKRKRSVWHTDLRRPVFVGCSEWIAGEARRSGLLEGCRVVAIPNPAPHGTPKASLPALPVLLFAAQKVTDPRKGMTLLVETLKRFSADAFTVEVLGSDAETLAEVLPQKVVALGYLRDAAQITEVYRSATLYVTPSLSDNLPNTIMEAMACGTPCVGFRVGGIPEMIDHGVNGYVARAGDVEDLARGIADVLEHRDVYSAAAVEKVHRAYSWERVVRMYESVYEK